MVRGVAWLVDVDMSGVAAATAAPRPGGFEKVNDAACHGAACVSSTPQFDGLPQNNSRWSSGTKRRVRRHEEPDKTCISGTSWVVLIGRQIVAESCRCSARGARTYPRGVNSDFKRVSEAKYVLLTTFRKDGTPVATSTLGPRRTATSS